MKKLFKLLLPLFLIFALVINVNAEGFVCNDGNTVKVTEVDKADPFGFDVYMPVCKWEMVQPETMVPYGRSTSLDELVKKATNNYKETVQKPGLDEKGMRDVQVGICHLGVSNVRVEVHCSYTQVKNDNETNYYHPKKDDDTLDMTKCNSRNANGSICYINHYCDDGWSKRKHGKDAIGGNDYQCTKKGNDYEILEQGIKIEDARKYEGKTSAEAQTIMAGKGKTYGSGYEDVSCEILFSVECPLYECEVETKLINACRPVFETEDGKPAYCVNPNQPFSQVGSTTAEYIEDTEFDVSKCEKSYNTVDCGYANILIEAAYANEKTDNKVCDNAVNLALRLWGVHTDQAGYTLSGLSRATGEKCDQEALFIDLDDGTVINVYRETHNYIMRHFYDIARSYDYIAPTGTHFESISCNYRNIGYGVTCAPSDDTKCGGGSTHVKAFELYFNTLLGNIYMQDHLAALFGNEMDTTPSDAYIDEDDEDDDYSYVEVKFNRITEMNNDGIVIDCDKLTEDDPNYKDIYPFCQVKVTIVDEDGNIITDDEGNPLDELKIKECIKGDGCRTQIFKYAICDETTRLNEEVIVRTKYKTTIAKRSVKKYIPCEDPETNQFLYAYYDMKTLVDEDEREAVSTETIVNTKDFPIKSFSCSGGCTDYGIRSDNKKSCSKDSEYDKEFSTYVKDPSLSCIVNMAPSGEKNTYDYTEYYGLNPNICRVYCSDEITYTMPTKKLLNSGLAFKYDISFNGLSKPDENILLSNTVEEKRRCVSEIYYSTAFPTSSALAIKTKYGLTKEESEKAKNWTTLFEVLAEKADKEGKRKENLQELIYDLYNCNIYSGNIPVKKPKDKVIGTTTAKKEKVYDYIKYLYDADREYGIGTTIEKDGDKKVLTDNGCDLKNNNNTCINLDAIYYTGGAEVYGKVGTTEDDITRVGKKTKGEAIKIKSIVGSSNINKTGIKYCNSGKNCFTYDGLENEKYEIDSSKFSNNSATSSVSHSSLGNITIPANDYAYFEVTTKVGFYNDSKFETHPYTGYVSEVTEDSTGIALDSYSYPMSKDAYSICGGETGEIHSCDISHNYGNIKTYYRNNKTDRFITAIGEKKSFGCFIDVKPPEIIDCTGKCSNNGTLDQFALYRNIDLKDPFPNERVGVTTNWTTPEAQKIIEDMKESADSIKTTTRELEYSIDLDTNNLNAYKNTDNDSYQNNTIIEDTCKIVDDKYLDCKSSFLEALRSDSNEGGGDYGRFKEGYSDGISEKNR